jgi:hypothetical protein
LYTSAFSADVNKLEGSVNTVKENAEALVVASKEIGLEVNADETKCIVISRDQDAGRSQNVKNDNSSVQRMEQLKYMGTTLTNQNSIRGAMKGSLM